MKWKYIKFGGLVLIATLILIPSILYLSAFDWSKKHTRRLAALPNFDSTVDKGEYKH